MYLLPFPEYPLNWSDEVRPQETTEIGPVSLQFWSVCSFIDLNWHQQYPTEIWQSTPDDFQNNDFEV